MGCSASKASEVVVPMPTKSSPQEENKTKELIIEAEATTTKKPIQVKQRSNDSLHGSQCSLNSNSDSGRSDRESSARSTRTTDSGLGELEDDPNIITERSSSDKQKIALVEERPPTPELSIEGTKVPRRKSLKEKRVSFSEKQEEVRNRINALSPMGGVTERPQSRGGMRFDVMLCPETGNVKRRPQHLKKLEKRKKRTRRTKEEIEEKLKLAEDRRKEREQQLIEKAQAMMTREKVNRALEDFAQRQISKEQTVSS